MKSIIYIATWPNGFFGSAGQSWISLNVQAIASHLEEFADKVQLITIKELPHIKLNKSDIVIYCSSDEENIRSYLKDIMYFVNKKCKIIPSYTALLAHENKGFQQLMRDEFDFGNLAGNYAFDIGDLVREKPYVIKKVTGAGSSGVSLIKNQKDEYSIKKSIFDVGIKRQRKFVLKNNEYELYDYRHKGFALAVTQDFISGLSCDYKVLVFGSKFFVLGRDVRENDFRASGSGKLVFEDTPHIVLDFAKKIFEQLNEPYASLDIAVAGNEAHLIEYQILNFGPYTLLNSPGYYIYKNNWKYFPEKSDLEDCFGYSLAKYIMQRT